MTDENPAVMKETATFITVTIIYILFTSNEHKKKLDIPQLQLTQITEPN